MTDQPETSDCSRRTAHPAHRYMLGRQMRQCPGQAQPEFIRPVEHCGAQFPAWEDQPPTECVLRPGHQGSHANEYDTRWIEKPAAGYCPHCGRGDAGPTADQYEQLRTAHRHEEELSADLRRRLQATSDACSDATTLLYRIGELHTTELSNEYGATECRTCRDPWPCDTANLLAALGSPKETP